MTPTIRVHLALALALALWLPGRALAAHADTPADSSGTWPPATDAHRPGRWSLDFAIGQNFTLSSFNGATLSATHATSEHSAWRLGVGTSVSTTRTTGGGAIGLADSTVDVQPGGKSHNDQVSVSLVAQRLHRFHPARRVGAYFALGPELSWNRYHYGNTEPFPPVNGLLVVDNFQHAFTIGLDADLGAEAMVARSVGLFAQYGSAGGYRITRQTLRASETTSAGVLLGAAGEVKLQSHAWFLDAQGVRFGLSLYL